MFKIKKLNMKINVIKLLIIIVGIVFISCNNNSNDPKPVVTTGGLIVKANLDGLSGYKSNVKISLATSLENLDNLIYLQEKKTGSNGSVNFGQLNTGNYYIDAYYEIGNDYYYGIAQVQIVSGIDKEVVLVLK
jgi:hypothetical protein